MQTLLTNEGLPSFEYFQLIDLSYLSDDFTGFSAGKLSSIMSCKVSFIYFKIFLKIFINKTQREDNQTHTLCCFVFFFIYTTKYTSSA